MNANAINTCRERILAKFARYMDQLDVGRLFEGVIESLYTSVLSPGDTAVDIGAHTGRHLLPMAKAVGKTGRVLGFEPIPRIRAKLAERVHKAGLDAVVEIFEIALSRESGTSSFTIVLADLGNSGLKGKPQFRGTAEEIITVRVETLDSMVGDKPVAFIKCDVEGGDFFALQGARRVLTEQRPVVAFEWGRAMAPVYGFDMAEFFGFFRDIGYVLKDALGCPLSSAHAHRFQCWELIAYPQERRDEVTDALSLAVAENVMGYAWPQIAPVAALKADAQGA